MDTGTARRRREPQRSGLLAVVSAKRVADVSPHPPDLSGPARRPDQQKGGSRDNLPKVINKHCDFPSACRRCLTLMVQLLRMAVVGWGGPWRGAVTTATQPGPSEKAKESGSEGRGTVAAVLCRVSVCSGVWTDGRVP